MSKIPDHFLPSYSDESLEDALFHYTTANGLMGILSTEEIWSTAYYCTNDESELAAGNRILWPLFRSKTYDLIKVNDPRILTITQRGINVYESADQFNKFIIAMVFSSLCAYITCFCKPISKEDFNNGLLSQWRGYGSDGGYVLHFSRKKLIAAIDSANKSDRLDYDLQDVYYKINNPKKDEIIKYADAFISEYMSFLDELAEPLDLNKRTRRNPLSALPGGPLEALINYLVYTKNEHFIEERECRLSLIQPVSTSDGCLSVQYFNRNGLLVPYIKTPASSFNVLDCLEWIIIGPGPRMDARFKSVNQLVRQSGRDIKVRASQIPFSRF
jgi:hypothetical protein